MIPPSSCKTYFIPFIIVEENDENDCRLFRERPPDVWDAQPQYHERAVRV